MLYFGVLSWFLHCAAISTNNHVSHNGFTAMWFLLICCIIKGACVSCNMMKRSMFAHKSWTWLFWGASFIFTIWYSGTYLYLHTNRCSLQLMVFNPLHVLIPCVQHLCAHLHVSYCTINCNKDLLLHTLAIVRLFPWCGIVSLYIDTSTIISGGLCLHISNKLLYAVPINTRYLTIRAIQIVAHSAIFITY